MTAPDLLPCPFCGSKARAEKSKAISGAWIVECKRGHSDGRIYTVKGHAIAAWNTRTTPLAEALAVPTEAQVEALLDAMETVMIDECMPFIPWREDCEDDQRIFRRMGRAGLTAALRAIGEGRA